MRLTVPTLLICIILIIQNSNAQDSISTNENQMDSIEYYKLEKIKQEVKKLQNENQTTHLIDIIPSYAGILTALVAIIGAIISFFKFIKEKQNEIEQKKEENKTRVAAKFDSIIKKLSSNNESIKATAAVSLLTFLKKGYEEFYDQVYLILLVNLKMRLSDNINRILLKTFEKAIRLKFETDRPPAQNDEENKFTLELNLTRMNLYRINLSELKGISNIDFSFSKLNRASLVGCKLIKSEGFKTDFSGARLSRSNMLEGRFNESIFEETHFHETNLVSAKLKNSNLKKAEFQRADLQDAHLDGAEIFGAKFEQANLNNTFMRGIKYNESDLLSILKSRDKSWQKAIFDLETKKKLDLLSSKKGGSLSP